MCILNEVVILISLPVSENISVHFRNEDLDLKNNALLKLRSVLQPSKIVL